MANQGGDCLIDVDGTQTNLFGAHVASAGSTYYLVSPRERSSTNAPGPGSRFLVLLETFLHFADLAWRNLLFYLLILLM